MGLRDWFSRRSDKGEPKPDPADDALLDRWLEHKSMLLEKTLGKEHDLVSHSLIPYALGGALDLYYYPNQIPGTGIATKELAERPNAGPANSIYKSYELVMFTRHALALDDSDNKETPFGRAHRNINAILNVIARYSAMATLNPNETSEFPADFEGGLAGKCLIFDGYAKHTDDFAKDFGLLAVVEVFRSEMNFAREHGGGKLIERLKKAGCYPYSDLEREKVA